MEICCIFFKFWKEAKCISTNSYINQSLEYCSRLIRDLENNNYIPENKFAGKTALALKEAQDKQIKKLKEVYNMLKYF